MPTVLKPRTHSQCNFCSAKGHLKASCFRYLAYKRLAQEETSQDLTVDIQEFAGNSCFKSSTLSSNPTAWNADTGATSHMTPNAHWLHNYAPLCIPIKLADNTVVYSAGVGSMVFQPVVNGQKQR